MMITGSDYACQGEQLRDGACFALSHDGRPFMFSLCCVRCLETVYYVNVIIVYTDSVCRASKHVHHFYNLTFCIYIIV